MWRCLHALPHVGTLLLAATNRTGGSSWCTQPCRGAVCVSVHARAQSVPWHQQVGACHQRHWWCHQHYVVQCTHCCSRQVRQQAGSCVLARTCRCHAVPKRCGGVASKPLCMIPAWQCHACHRQYVCRHVPSVCTQFHWSVVAAALLVLIDCVDTARRGDQVLA